MYIVKVVSPANIAYVEESAPNREQMLEKVGMFTDDYLDEDGWTIEIESYKMEETEEENDV